MAESKQVNQPAVHRLEEKPEKIVTAKLFKGRWFVELETNVEQILTVHDIITLTKTLAVARRQKEHVYRQNLRKENRVKNELQKA